MARSGSSATPRPRTCRPRAHSAALFPTWRDPFGRHRRPSPRALAALSRAAATPATARSAPLLGKQAWPGGPFLIVVALLRERQRYAALPSGERDRGEGRVSPQGSGEQPKRSRPRAGAAGPGSMFCAEHWLLSGGDSKVTMLLKAVTIRIRPAACQSRVPIFSGIWHAGFACNCRRFIRKMPLRATLEVTLFLPGTLISLYYALFR